MFRNQERDDQKNQGDVREENPVPAKRGTNAPASPNTERALPGQETPGFPVSEKDE